MSEALGNRIKERRAEHGLTQAELAELCLVSRKTINTVENDFLNCIDICYIFFRIRCNSLFCFIWAFLILF